MNEKEFESLSRAEKDIYYVCEYPRSNYEILAEIANIHKLNYQSICQKTGTLVAKGYLSKMQKGKGFIFRAIPLEKEEVKDAVV